MNVPGRYRVRQISSNGRCCSQIVSSTRPNTFLCFSRIPKNPVFVDKSSVPQCCSGRLSSLLHIEKREVLVPFVTSTLWILRTFKLQKFRRPDNHRLVLDAPMLFGDDAEGQSHERGWKPRNLALRTIVTSIPHLNMDWFLSLCETSMSAWILFFMI